MKLAAAVAAVTLAGCGRDVPLKEKPPTPVAVTAVEEMAPQSGERYSASILPDRQVTLSFRVSGVVDQIHQVAGPRGKRALDIGDVLPAGTVLARLRRQDYDLQVGQAGGQLAEARGSQAAVRAQVAQAEAAARKAQQDFERARFLFDNRSLTQPDLDAAQAQHDATRAQVEAARAQLQAVSARIGAAEAALGTASLARDDTAIIAPFTGAVVQRNIELGSLAGPSIAAIVLADLSTVKAAFGVPDMVVVTLKPGSERTVTVEALPGRRFTGRIGAIAAAADPSTRLFQVDLSIPNPGGLLRPGMVASLEVISGKPSQPLPAVPLSAIIRAEKTEGFAVMVIEGGTAHRRGVTPGEPHGDRITITSGVRPGELVVTRGAGLLAEGERVEVIR